MPLRMNGLIVYNINIQMEKILKYLDRHYKELGYKPGSCLHFKDKISNLEGALNEKKSNFDFNIISINNFQFIWMYKR